MGKIEKRQRPREPLQPATTQGSLGTAPAHRWRRHGWRLLAIWGLILVAYSNSFHAALVFDSISVIGRDPRIREATPASIESVLTGRYWYINAAAGLYRPLTTFSYLLNYAILGDGPRPQGYHVVNFVLHEVNVTLVYALGVLLFGEAAPALALAAIWGLHPLLTESVTNIVGRADLLAALGVLAGLLCYVRGAGAVGWRRVAWLAGLVAGQAVGIFSKENAAVLPGIMLLYDLTWPNRAAWRRRAPAYGLLALPFAAFFYLRSGLHAPMRIDFVENPLVSAGFWTARLTALQVIGKYLWLYLWPARLSADYSYHAVPLFGWRASNWENLQALMELAASVGAVILTGLLAVRWRHTARLLFFLVFFFVALSPTSNLIILIGSIMGERFLYLPSVGLAGFAVAALCALGRRRFPQLPAAVRAAWVVLGLVCLAFTARTYTRNVDWQGARSLWTSTIAVYPQDAKAHFNLGDELERTPGQLTEAVAEYQAALRILPDDADTHNNLGIALSGIPGRLPEAIAEYQAALRIRPDDVDAYNNLGIALARIPGRLPEAIDEYQAALRIRPDDADSHYNLGIALSGIPGRLPEAIAEYQAALQIRPDYVKAHNNLAGVLARTPGRMPDAIAEYQAVLRIQPNDATAHYNLGNALTRMPGRMPEAIAEYQAAVRIEPDSAEAHSNLASALSGIPGRLPEAIAEYQAALRIRPNDANLHENLGIVLSGVPGRLPDAIAQLEAALEIRPDPEVRQMLDLLRRRQAAAAPFR